MRQSIRSSQHSERRQPGGFEGNASSFTGLKASKGKGKGGMHGATGQHDSNNFYRTQHSPMGGVPLSEGRGPESAGSSSMGRGRGRRSFRSGGGRLGPGGGFRQVMNTF